LQFDFCSWKTLYSDEAAGKPLFYKGYCITSTDTQVTKNILHKLKKKRTFCM